MSDRNKLPKLHAIASSQASENNKKLHAIASSKSCCEIIDQRREPISITEFRKLMHWTYSDRGTALAAAWEWLNHQCFHGVLLPCPILLPSSPPYGHWVGLCTGNPEGETVHIQLKRDMPLPAHFDVLLHECIHAYLREKNEPTSHNELPWCREIMRLSKELWDVDVWASPSQPRKVKGASRRVQKLSSDGRESISLPKISQWPQSIGLAVIDAKDWKQ